MATKVYLDYAAATPLDQEVFALMRPYFSRQFYNPSADYAAARDTKKTLNAARSKVAYWLGAQTSEIIFTAGGTEANNLALHGLMAGYPGAKLVASSIEHESILNPARRYAHSEAPVLLDGRVDIAKLEDQIDDNTVLVSVMYANNEIGVIEPLRKIAVLLDKIKRSRKERGVKLPLIYHADACQAANYLDLHVSRLGVDMMTLNGGKIYGPKQSGVLYVKRGISLTPQIEGGGQEFNLRSGTENVPSAVGLAAALDKAQSIRSEEAVRLTLLRDYFIDRLTNDLKAEINGSKEFRLPNNVHATFKQQDNEYLLIGMDRLGIMAAAGSACSASKEESSHVLRSLGLSDQEARSSIRFTLGRQTTKGDIDKTVKVIKQLVSN